MTVMNEKISHLCSFILSKIPKNGDTTNPLSVLALCDDGGYFPIHYLSASGSIDYLRLYLEVISMIPGGKSLVDIRDSQGSTALHHAVKHGQVDVVRTLVQAGAMVNIQNFEAKTALFNAVSQFKENYDRNLIYDIVKALLYFGANPNISDENGVTPLHVACSLGIIPLVDLLIDNGAWINVRDGDGETPIFYALRDGKNLIVERLVMDFGVNLEEANEDGETPLDLCKSIGDQDMEKLILTLSKVPPVKTFGGMSSSNRNEQSNVGEEKMFISA